MAMKNLIKRFCDDRGLTPYALSRDAKLAQGTAYTLYNSEDAAPSMSTVSKICHKYGVQPTDIVIYVPDETSIADGEIAPAAPEATTDEPATPERDALIQFVEKLTKGDVNAADIALTAHITGVNSDELQTTMNKLKNGNGHHAEI